MYFVVLRIAGEVHGFLTDDETMLPIRFNTEQEADQAMEGHLLGESYFVIDLED